MDKHELLLELDQHYQMWTDDNERRLHRINGWNDVTDAYYGKLPDDWPYMTKIVDPRIRTTLIEKNARLLNSKLRGRLVPRENADTIQARINNALLDFQWDTASEGGSMQMKMSIADMDARLYGTKFALIVWRYEEDDEGNVVFDSNDMIPLDLRDCGIDPTATHIRDAKWFQHREWKKFEDLENETYAGDEAQFKNLDTLKRRVMEKMGDKGKSIARSTTRTTEYQPRGLQLRGLEDRTGEDRAFPVVKIVTEYRRDKWITFAPDHDIVLREIDNPYDHGRIPVAQLRYYPLQDDPLGESEVESVLPLWKAIQATVCSYMDEVILKMRPPLKVIENAARIETIQYGPEAQWLVDRQDAVEEMGSRADSLQYFQTTYAALTSAFNIAMGDLSQGTSQFDPFDQEAKTATEVRQTARQQNTRDQKNQNDLADFIKDIMMMWLANNKQFLFTDPTKARHILRIVGRDNFAYLERAGLSEKDIPDENLSMISDIIQQDPDISDIELERMVETGSVPRHPVLLNPEEKDPEKFDIVPKLSIGDTQDTAELSIIAQDLEGTYDYIPDVKSMSTGAGEELTQARQQAVQLLTSNQAVLQLLQQEGYRPKVKELTSSVLEDLGLKDAERFFEKIQNEQQQPVGQPVQPQGPTQEAPQANGGVGQPSGVGGLQGAPQANPLAGL